MSLPHRLKISERPSWTHTSAQEHGDCKSETKQGQATPTHSHTLTSTQTTKLSPASLAASATKQQGRVKEGGLGEMEGGSGDKKEHYAASHVPALISV